MYIYQNGKVYVLDGKYIVGVDISPLNIKKVKGSRIKLEGDYAILTPSEVRAKFGIATGGEYKFPLEEKEETKEVVKDEPATKTKSTTRGRKSTGK